MKSLKKFCSVSLLACIVYFCSCDKKNNPNNNNNNNNTDTVSWDWTGTPPFSCEINDTTYTLDTNGTNRRIELYNNSGTLRFVTIDYPGKRMLNIAFPENAVAGDVLNFYYPGTAYATFQRITSEPVQHLYVSFSGKCKIIQNSATEIEGYFYANVNYTDTIAIRKGYFKIPK